MMLLMPGHTCGDHCWHAREDECKCSCGGKNHGILRNGGAMPKRTRKMAGKFYELMEIGRAREIDQRRLDLTRECNHHWLFDPHGPYLAKPITDAQRRWPEVVAVADATYILWGNSELAVRRDFSSA